MTSVDVELTGTQGNSVWFSGDQNSLNEMVLMVVGNE